MKLHSNEFYYVHKLIFKRLTLYIVYIFIFMIIKFAILANHGYLYKCMDNGDS